MRYLSYLIGIVFLMFLVIISIQNSHETQLKFFMMKSWDAPLILFLLIFFILGTLVGLLASFLYCFRFYRKVGKLKKTLKQVTVKD